MQVNKPDYITDIDWKLLQAKYKNMHRVINRLNKNYPVQYLIGNVNFYGYDLIVNKNVLIPRFETETLLEKTLEYLKEYKLEDTKVLEIGSGSGCIPITLKKKMSKLNITSIDKSRKALKVARLNASNNQVEIDFKQKNIFKFKSKEKYGLIISNPPYIRYDLKIDPKCKYEPNMALYADHDGLIFYDYILKELKNNLLDKSIIAFEIGEEQGAYLTKMARKYYPHSTIILEKDLSNRDRYIFVINE